MKVAIDGRSLTEGRQTGVQEYVRQMVRALAEVGQGEVEIEVFISGVGAELQEKLPPAVQVSAWRWPNKVLTSSQWLLAWPRWERTVAADVFLFPNLQLLPLAAKTPVVAVAHDLSFEQFPEFLTARRRLWHRMVGPQQFFTRANAVVAVSEHTKRDLLDWYGLPEEKVRVVYSGVRVPERELLANEVRSVRERWGLPERYVLFLGAMEPRKNIVGIVRAFEEIAHKVPHDLVLAGEYGWREGEIAAAVRKSVWRERIHRLGAVSDQDKWALYAGAEAFVYPSFYEGFGFPPLEALSCGTPVITSVSSALPEVVGQWAVLVDPASHGQLALALEQVLAEGRRVPGAVRSEIGRRYRWEESARQMIDVLGSVV